MLWLNKDPYKIIAEMPIVGNDSIIPLNKED